MAVIINASTSTGLVQSADTSGVIELQSNGTTALKVNTNEGIQILNCLGVGNATPSTSGAGITFPATQSASSDANTLDDYEEGTWTPVLDRNSSSPSVTYISQAGKYTKIGNLVNVSFGLNWSANSGGAGNYKITGLPFAIPSGDANYLCNITIDMSGVTFPASRTMVGVQGAAGNSFMQLVGAGSNVITSGVDTVGNAGFIFASFTYFTS